jgi:hypothetical protein
MSYTIVDRKGQELKSGDYVLIATSCTARGYMRVARVKGITEKPAGWRGTVPVVEIRSMCATKAYWGKHKGKDRMVQGVIDRPITGQWNHSAQKCELPSGPQQIECVRIDDPTLYMTDTEVQLAKAKGLI